MLKQHFLPVALVTLVIFLWIPGETSAEEPSSTAPSANPKATAAEPFTKVKYMKDMEGVLKKMTRKITEACDATMEEEANVLLRYYDHDKDKKKWIMLNSLDDSSEKEDKENVMTALETVLGSKDPLCLIGLICNGGKCEDCVPKFEKGELDKEDAKELYAKCWKRAIPQLPGNGAPRFSSIPFALITLGAAISLAHNLF